MDSPSTPRARYPASKSRFLSLRKSERVSFKSPNEDSETPNKTVHFHVNILSPSLKQSNINVDVMFSPNQSNNLFSPVPLYKTPPSSGKDFVPFNPFNCGLQERLKRSILSPSVFSSIRNPTKTAETEFRWSIEDVARIKPANIEEDFHYDDQMDPEAESQAQEAIEKFFSDTQLAPSPSPNVNETQNPTACLQTPCTSVRSAISSTPRRDSLRNTKKTVDACVQTGLSLPPELPEEVEAILSRYFIQTESTNDDSLSTSSMRRKLFFQCEDEPPSPVKPARMIDLSPVTSGLASSPSFQHYFPSTPVITSRTVDVPNSQLSSPGCSPISYNCSGTASPNSSAASRVSMRLDFGPGNKENVPMDVSSDNAQDSLIKGKGSHSIVENQNCKMSYIEDSENANFSLIKVKADENETQPNTKPFVKTTHMEYMNSTSVLMSCETTEIMCNSQKANSQNLFSQFSSASKTYSSEDTGYQSRSCFNTNSELTEPMSSSDSQFNDSTSMELPAKRHFSDECHREINSVKSREKVFVFTPPENILSHI